MEYKNYGDITVARLDKGDEIVKSIIDIAAKEGIKTGFFSAIGATDNFEVGVFNLETNGYDRKSYTGNHEITELSGNITTLDGKPYVHAHINCAGKDGSLVGGHLFEGKISLTCEIFITKVDGEIARKFDSEIGINKFTF